jgi:hypothetical protein
LNVNCTFDNIAFNVGFLLDFLTKKTATNNACRLAKDIIFAYIFFSFAYIYIYV